MVGLPVAGVMGCERKRLLDSPALWDAEGARRVCKVQEGLDKLLEGHHALKIHTELLPLAMAGGGWTDLEGM